MAANALFGPPVQAFTPGGAHIAVHLVPVFAGAVVAFDVSARDARGRWLPWDLLPYGGNPYETAAALGDDWCDGAVLDLAIIDALSFPLAGESWELALVFRAGLAAAPGGDSDRTPVLLSGDALASISRFEAVDIARWLGETAPAVPAPQRKGGDLLF